MNAMHVRLPRARFSASRIPVARKRHRDRRGIAKKAEMRNV